jgi:deoxyinosine 3'endonuclease (endonuclease V)
MAGFLGFREAPALIEAFSRLYNTNPSLIPECILVDGNGILHPRGYGLASHVGELECYTRNVLIHSKVPPVLN